MNQNDIERLLSNLHRLVSRQAFERAGGGLILPPDVPVALMFTDIESFTAKTMAMNIQAIDLLSLYFGTMSECVYERGGDIDKFIGDAIFACFFDIEAPENAANIAFEAAMEMAKQEKILAEENEAWDAVFRDRPEWEQYRRFRTRIGLHWGKVVAGPFGSEERADSTLMGDNVNLAARMEALNKKYGAYVLLTDDFFLKLSDANKRLCRRVDRITVVGREGSPLDIYVVDPVSLPGNFLDHFNQGLSHYIDGDWHAAHQSFTAAQDFLKAESMPEDGPVKALIDRIEDTNSFWEKAVRNLGDNVPDIFTPDIASAIAERLSQRPYAAPMDWPGYWRHERK